MTLDAGAWAELERKGREAKTSRLEELTRIVQTSPVPDAVLPELAWMMSDEFDCLMRGHPGRRAEDRYASLQAILGVFRTALADLISALDRFHDFSREPNAFGRSRRSEFEAVERSIQKEFFAVSDATHALVDHCRKFTSAMPIPESLPETNPLI